MARTASARPSSALEGLALRDHPLPGSLWPARGACAQSPSGAWSLLGRLARAGRAGAWPQARLAGQGRPGTGRRRSQQSRAPGPQAAKSPHRAWSLLGCLGLAGRAGTWSQARLAGPGRPGTGRRRSQRSRAPGPQAGDGRNTGPGAPGLAGRARAERPGLPGLAQERRRGGRDTSPRAQAPHCRPGQGEPRRAQSPDRGGSQAAGGGWGPGPVADGE